MTGAILMFFFPKKNFPHNVTVKFQLKMGCGSLVTDLNILVSTTRSVPTISLRNTWKILLSVAKYGHLNPLSENKELGFVRYRPFIC